MIKIVSETELHQDKASAGGGRLWPTRHLSKHGLAVKPILNRSVHFGGDVPAKRGMPNKNVDADNKLSRRKSGL